MGLKQVNYKVVSYCEIPEELTKKHWISEYPAGSFAEVHLDIDGPSDKLDEWLIQTYPELIDEDAFFIEMDY